MLAPFAFLLQGSANLIAALQLYHDDCGVTTRTGARIWSLSNADDIVLLATTKTELQRMLDAAAGEMRRARMRFNPKKCKVVVFRGRNDPRLTLKCISGRHASKSYPASATWGLSWISTS